MSRILDPKVKWSAAYEGPRNDLVQRVQSAPQTVLDVGCGGGAFGRDLKRRYPGVSVHGIELNDRLRATASEILDETTGLDLNRHEDVQAFLLNRSYDLIVLADVLEHMIDPWGLVGILCSHVNTGGYLLVSLPNIAHISMFRNLLALRWPLNNRGICDSTHLRYFMYGDLYKLAPVGWETRIVERKYRLIERRRTRWDRIVRNAVGWIPHVREYLVFQYVFRIQRSQPR